MAAELKTLQQAVSYFSNPDNCVAYLVARRWPNGVICPTCGSTKVSYLTKTRRWQCTSRHSKRQFTLKTGTIMEDSPLGVDKWMVATWLAYNCRNGISSYEIARALGISQKSAWHLMHRVRFTVHEGDEKGKMSGHVEVDETFIGGAARNMHKAKRAEKNPPRDRAIALVRPSSWASWNAAEKPALLWFRTSDASHSTPRSKAC